MIVNYLPAGEAGKSGTAIVDIDTIRATMEAGDWHASDHCLDRLDEREIDIAQVFEVIRSGEIVEELSDRAPDPVCIVRGIVERRIEFLKLEYPLYVVCAVGDVITFVTADWNPPREFGQKRGRGRR